MNRILAGSGLLVVSLMFLVNCDGSGPSDEQTSDPKDGKATVAPATIAAPEPVQESLEGGPYPTLLVAQAWFYKDEANRPKPGPARLELWRETPDGWRATRLEDGDSNVFHKAIAVDGGIVTIGAEGANLKKWTVAADGGWSSETLWSQSWGGKFNRLRDLEIGDVDGDGKDEYIIATHDAGVVAVYNPDTRETIELDQEADIFVHEIEIGDIDGDGAMEFFATPTGRNQANSSQGGQMVMYRWDGTTYVRTIVDPFGETHAKEILVADMDGDGTAELFSVVEAATKGRQIVQPVEIRQYARAEDGSFTHSVLTTIDDRQTRFLIPGDFNGDGKMDLVAAAMKTGLWFLTQGEDGVWTKANFDQSSSGFEHTSYASDLDGDGVLELYVAADDQQELKKYTWDAAAGSFKKTLLGRLDDNTITWNITTGSF
jgi:hypothetical protein